ncbi:unnamed protein product [Effrenium voratum]|nr:unnamed protein product [Effrenium voratum]
MGRSRSLERQLRDFRERFPIDERAADFLEKVSDEVLSTVLSEFRPKREGEGNYSALVTNFVRSVQSRISRQQHSRVQDRSSSSEPRRRRRRTRYRHSSSESEDSFGRRRKPSVQSPSSPPLKPKRKVEDSEEESALPEPEQLDRLQAAVQHAQDELTRVEADARDDERLKAAKAEDEYSREVEEATVQVRERAERDMELKLKDLERRLRNEMEQAVEDGKVAAEEAAQSRRLDAERDARQERERLVAEAERSLRSARKAQMLAQKKIERSEKKAAAKAKRMLSKVSSSQSPPRKKEKKVEKEKAKKEKREDSDDSGLLRLTRPLGTDNTNIIVSYQDPRER